MGRNLTPSIFQLSYKNIAAPGCGWKERTRQTATQPIKISGDFDFSTPSLRLVRTVPGGTRPRAAIGRFSRLYGSHLNTPRFEAHYHVAAGSNWLNYEKRRHNRAEHGADTLLRDLYVTHRAALSGSEITNILDSLVSFLFQLFLPVNERLHSDIELHHTQEVTLSEVVQGVDDGVVCRNCALYSFRS